MGGVCFRVLGNPHLDVHDKLGHDVQDSLHLIRTLNSKFEVLCPYKSSCDNGLKRCNPRVDTLSNTWGVTSAAEGEALRIERERNGVAPNQNWQTPYLQYLLRGELPLDKAEA
jgi:hypothetical protein